MLTYTARLYFDVSEINSSSGNDLDSLFIWLLAQAQGKSGNFNGQVINNKTNSVEKEFRTTPHD